MHITLELVRNRTGYRPGEEPRYAERSGPNCRGLPDPPVPAPDHKLDDGTADHDAALLPGGAAPAGAAVTATEAEQHVVGPLVAPVMGVAADEVPTAATLLFGPLVRGTEVSVA